MMQVRHEPQRVLSIDLCNRGVGFVVLEGPEKLVDWGVTQVKPRTDSRTLSRIETIVDLYQPDSLVFEDGAADDCRRCERVKHLIGKLPPLAAARNIKAHSVPWPQVRRTFSDSGAFTKYQIACAVALELPMLVRWLPPVRKPWMSEDYRMSIFDAAAFALTFYAQHRKQTNPHNQNP